ncbi:MAG: hypothetical protein ACLUFL_06220 [Flavonifractor plautii]
MAFRPAAELLCWTCSPWAKTAVNLGVDYDKCVRLLGVTLTPVYRHGGPHLLLGPSSPISPASF